MNPEQFTESIIDTALAFHNKFICPDGQHATDETVELATEYVTWIVLRFLEFVDDQKK